MLHVGWKVLHAINKDEIPVLGVSGQWTVDFGFSTTEDD